MIQEHHRKLFQDWTAEILFATELAAKDAEVLSREGDATMLHVAGLLNEAKGATAAAHMLISGQITVEQWMAGENEYLIVRP